MSLRNPQEINDIRGIINEIGDKEYRQYIEKFVKDFPQYKIFLLNPEFNQTADQIVYCLTKENEKCLVIQNNFGNTVETLSNIYQQVYSQNEHKECIEFQKIRFRNNENVNFVHSDIENLSFPENYFDLIVFENFNNFIETIEKNQLESFVKKISRVLKIGGCFCVNNKNRNVEKIFENHNFKIKKYWSMQSGHYPTVSGKKNDDIGIRWYLKNSEKFHSSKNNLKKQIAVWGMQKTSKPLAKILNKKLFPTEILCCFKNKSSESIIDFIQNNSGYNHYVILSRPKKIIGVLINSEGKAQKIINFNRYGTTFPKKIVEINREFPDMDDPKERLWMEEWFDGETIEQEKFDQVLKAIDWLMRFQNDTKQSAITNKEIEQEISEMKNQMNNNEYLNKPSYFKWIEEYREFFKNNILYCTAMHGDFWINNILLNSETSKIKVIDWERYRKKESQMNDFMYFIIRLMTKSKNTSIDLQRLENFLDDKSNGYNQILKLKKKLDLHLDCNFKMLLFLRVYMIKRILEKPYGTSIVNQESQLKQVRILQILEEKQSLFE